MKFARALWLMIAMLFVLYGLPLLRQIFADGKPVVQLNADRAAPRQVDEGVQQAITRDYAAAWQAMGDAVNANNPGALNEYFVGLALDKLTGRIRDQQSFGLKTRLIDRGHKVEAVFYSVDGSAMELKDTASIETQILDGNTILHSDNAQVQYYVVMTGAEDHWKVRVLESIPTRTD
jgi:hypothetical protein